MAPSVWGWRRVLLATVGPETSPKQPYLGAVVSSKSTRGNLLARCRTRHNRHYVKSSTDAWRHHSDSWPARFGAPRSKNEGGGVDWPGGHTPNPPRGPPCDQ